jgi:hypothetical protein
MLITASDGNFADAQEVSRVLVASWVAPTRAAIEGGDGRGCFEGLRYHLTALSLGNLKQVSAVETGRSPHPAM